LVANPDTIASLADALWEAERTRIPISPPTDQHPDLVIDDAYAIQTHNIVRRTADGARMAGRKIGLTSKGMQELLGVDEPDYGVLLRQKHKAAFRKNEGASLTYLPFMDRAISNPGPLGTCASAAIINQPNVGIITTEGVSRRPTVVGDAIAIHHLCVLGLPYDHRAFDGVTAARFLAYIRDALQDRDWEAELA